MKRIAIVSVALTALLLSACGVNNDDTNDTAVQDRDKQAKVNNIGNDLPNGSKANNRNEADNNLTNTNNGNNDTQRTKLAGQIEAEVVSMNEVNQSSVTIKNNNAYVAVQLDNNNKDLSKDTAQRIGNLAKSIDPNIENVYISVNPDGSVNPDASDRMNELSNDSQWTSN
ncbi:YhcN/YlaJ family sporulation lipoprotein [Bacillus sp. FJAT-27251]|uniref:YhcN/YlaJ family sporulation lipoprotein n=1 Tax=Bacillus sp. FJAT-27251 TaxID=1684142 RepID=UPI0006A761F1|nr:YhcN/YlaJ family sporulation lipoprotein [Bacillus sp. FJAT-27251]